MKWSSTCSTTCDRRSIQIEKKARVDAFEEDRKVLLYAISVSPHAE